MAFIDRAVIGHAMWSVVNPHPHNVPCNQFYNSTLLSCCKPNSADIPGTFFDNLLAYYIQMQRGVRN